MKQLVFLILFSLLFASACAIGGDEIWRTERVQSLVVKVPAYLTRTIKDNLTLFVPAGTTDGLPWVGVAIPSGAPLDVSPENMLLSLRPAPAESDPIVGKIKAKIAGVECSGYETRSGAVHGWSYVLQRGSNAAGLLLIAVPQYWSPDQAEAFREKVLTGVAFQ